MRTRPAGIEAGSPGTRISGPGAALGLVAAELAAAESVLQDLIHTDVAAVPAVAGYLVASGGKRLRPALTALGARAVGHTLPLPRLMCVGELLHLGSLLHDDVVDDGVTRRGRPAAHRVYGNAVTVLTGDFCLARSVLLAAEEGGFRAVTALGHTVTEMAEGEVLQLQRAGDLSCTVDQYLDVVARKSAALIAWCAAAGAWAADRDDLARPLLAFGRGVGIAFQITDDVLDYAEGTGKEAGADLRERKVTLPLLIAMERVEGLKDRLEAGPPSPSEVHALMAEVRACGALEDALEEARRRVAAAVQALDALPRNEGTEALCALADYLVERAL
ncbi:MAG: polyprenyl synthetase family protein [Myxococcales bacterium]|nr:polyprenyl synthetase family protein [Myxococcales bacterium]